MIVIEDTHFSYMKQFGNPCKFSFINFAKKVIDDVNHRGFLKNKFYQSFNKYVYSINFFSSVVVFNVNKNLCNPTKIFVNKKKILKYEDFRYGLDNISNIYKYIYKFKLLFLLNLSLSLYHNFKSLKIKKYFT